MEAYYRELIFPVCGKGFVVADIGQWIYKIRDKNNNRMAVCSWKCLQEYRRTNGKIEKHHAGGGSKDGGR